MEFTAHVAFREPAAMPEYDKLKTLLVQLKETLNALGIDFEL